MGAIAKTDIELVEASLRGEHEAFGHLVARYQDVVCAVSYSSTGDQVLSEDVAQDTFIAAWCQLGRLRNSQRLQPWLCGIARNLARTARKRRRRQDLVDADQHIASDTTPFDIAARSDVERVVRDALARIPGPYREVLVLYYREDQSIREVAEALGLSESTVMQRLSRGRRHLADSVSELVERSLQSGRRQRDLVAAVLASIALLAIPSRVDASPAKGSTMLKFAIAASVVVAAGTTVYLVHSHSSEPAPRVVAPATLHYGSSQLGLAHAPTLGPTAAPRVIASRSTATADLALLPADADVVIGVNFAQVRRSALWQRYVEPKLADASGIRELQAMCGFDPLASLGSISIGVKGVGDEDDTIAGVIVIHGFDKAKAMSCFDAKGLPEARASGSEVTIDRNVVLFTDGKNHDHHAAFTFLDERTALIVLGDDAATREGVERIAAGDSGLQSSSAFSEALQSINTDDSLWLVLSEHSPLVAKFNAAAAELTQTKLGTAYVSMNVTDTFALDAGFRLGSPAAVAKAVTAIEAQMKDVGPMAKLFFDQLDVLADGSDLIVSLAMSGDQIGQVLSSIAANATVTSAEL